MHVSITAAVTGCIIIMHAFRPTAAAGLTALTLIISMIGIGIVKCDWWHW
jgi:hypothetical protein